MPTSTDPFAFLDFMYENRDTMRFALAIAFGTLTLYWYFFGNRHQRNRKKLEKELREAQLACRELEDKLAAAEVDELQKSGKEVRVWMDGAWDMIHYGHMNALRLGRSLGTKLYVGLNNDESITACKGKPITCESERKTVLEACKFCDEVVEDVPYVMNAEYIKHIVEKYKIDIIVHGDDPCIVDGKDVYEDAKKTGKFRSIPRTEGISTTDILGRMLLVSSSHHTKLEEAGSDADSAITRSRASSISHTQDQLASKQDVAPLGRMSNFMTTSRVLRLFSAGMKAPMPTDKVIYLAGAWDLFHAGHCEILKAARELGDYVIVGVHSDRIVNQIRGANLPILNMHERCLSVLGCKYVDDVLIDAPYVITQEMMSSLNIHMVVHGTMPGSSALPSPVPSCAALADMTSAAAVPGSELSTDPYALPRKMNKLKGLPIITRNMTVLDMVERIEDQRERFTAKYQRKVKQENEYYKNRYNL